MKKQDKEFTIKEALDVAVEHHNAGRLSEADNIYRLVLNKLPNQHIALNLSGLILHQTGKSEMAVDQIKKAIDSNPKYTHAYNNLGTILMDLNRFEEAAQNFNAATNIDPNYALAFNNLGNAHFKLGNNEEAAKNYQKTISIDPKYSGAFSNLGTVLITQGKWHEAYDSFLKALETLPDNADIYSNLGVVLVELGRWEEAADNYKQALSINPNHTDAMSNYAILLNNLGNRKLALSFFSKRLALVRGEYTANLDLPEFKYITRSKIKHDIEQFRFLQSTYEKNTIFGQFAAVYSELENEIRWPASESEKVLLSEAQKGLIKSSYNQFVHVIDAEEIPDGALNKDLDVEAITRSYFENKPGMMFFDNFLNDLALKKLRRFLMESTIWFDFGYAGGYLGAMYKDGMACPLLLQIADELSQTFPEIIKKHPLTQMWAYKYDSQLTGIRNHADAAAVNVNFWITPNSANLDTKSGGLIVHKAEAPLDWDFRKFNRDENLINQFLENSQAGELKVPYAENRMVLFNSNLFHKTDNIRFKTGYENRRINVTMLFGNRLRK
ncbi:MAG: tetratricopeptide repeat protein [Alphaproteobacteria bacterium]|nr:tetratricopeptide repeat protein [Alphaproteobacteria bacterium]